METKLESSATDLKMNPVQAAAELIEDYQDTIVNFFSELSLRHLDESGKLFDDVIKLEKILTQAGFPYGDIQDLFNEAHSEANMNALSGLIH